MLTVKQVAKCLTVSEANIYRLIACGKLKAHRLGVQGGAIRIQECDLDQYLHDSEVASASQEPRSSKRRLRHLKLN